MVILLNPFSKGNFPNPKFPTIGPTGEHPFGPVQNFPSSPSSSPSHILFQAAFSNPLEFQIGLDRKSEHLTNFDIRSSGDFSAGKPHVSVGRRPQKVNISKSKFNNLKGP